jgi:hypothetical protein
MVLLATFSFLGSFFIVALYLKTAHSKKIFFFFDWKSFNTTIRRNTIADKIGSR